MPNTAITASPMNFSTVPPWRSITAAISSKKRPITRRRVSGSSFSPRAVEPVTSANTTVTTLRTSPAGAGFSSASGDAHWRQKRARAGFSSPQFGHRFTNAS